tara:strand:- start:1123 stop:1368 length:246 start_codon:yes stop_codon:yes gene_type:complete
MRKTLFLETELGQVVVPRLENSSWLGRWAYDSWLKKHFKRRVEKAPKENWEIMSAMFEVKTLIEENDIYRVENNQKPQERN